MKQQRRSFLKQAGQAAALVPILSLGPRSVLGANDRVRMGGIGVGDRGTDRLKTAQRLGADVVVLCDVNQLMLDRAGAVCGGSVERMEDHRQLLERKDIDAVVIAPPDHWHHDIFLDAIRAGKDVYIEKPLSKTIAEGESMVQAAQQSNQVVQVGNHRRSGTHWHAARQAIQDGMIGEIKWVRSYDCRDFSQGDPYQLRSRDPNLYNPEKINWKHFLGNAPDRPYTPERASAWRWYWDYAGGLLTDIGAHNNDVAMWMSDCLDVRSVTANGGNYFFDFWETPDVVHATFDCRRFSIDFTVQFINGHDGYGHSIYGTKGCIVQQYPDNVVYLYSQGDRRKPVVKWEMNDEGTAHMQNFLDCVKSRKPTNSPIATAHKIITACHLSNLAYRQETKVKWDGEQAQVG